MIVKEKWLFKCTFKIMSAELVADAQLPWGLEEHPFAISIQSSPVLIPMAMEFRSEATPSGNTDLHCFPIEMC